MINFLRNTFSVILGVAAALTLITIVITYNPHWIKFDYGSNYISIFDHWRRVIVDNAKSGHRNEFFAALVVSTGIGAFAGGIVTAMLVKNAKKAYAAFTGFIIFLISLGDIIFTPSHPTWYEFSIWPVTFLFSWLGGLVVDLINKAQKRVKEETKKFIK